MRHGCLTMTNHHNGSFQESLDRKKACQIRSNVEVLLTVFFDCNDMLHHEFLWQGRAVNKKYYSEVMSRLREAIRQKRTELWKNESLILQHDNVPAHTSMLVPDFVAKTVIKPQPHYSSDLAPSGFFLLPKLKTPMKAKHFAMIEVIKEKLKQDMLAITKSAFQKYFEDWKNCGNKCILSEGD